jgi:hypothetical protein
MVSKYENTSKPSVKGYNEFFFFFCYFLFILTFDLFVLMNILFIKLYVYKYIHIIFIKV